MALVPGNPPTLPLPTFGTIDSFGFAGNWLVRGFGQGTSACDNPADVPWLSVAPTAGSSPSGGSSPVTVGFNSTGLAVGTYNATLCVTSNDPQTPLVEVPVSLTVQSANAIVLSALDASQSPMPSGAPMAALPFAAASVFVLIVALRRRR